MDKEFVKGLREGTVTLFLNDLGNETDLESTKASVNDETRQKSGTRIIMTR